jgi:hypothetical protein
MVNYFNVSLFQYPDSLVLEEAVFWVVALCSLVEELFALIMEAAKYLWDVSQFPGYTAQQLRTQPSSHFPL